ncbi:MAG: hypothetical protein ACK52I_01110 [Pseudomonadota bacterium]
MARVELVAEPQRLVRGRRRQAGFLEADHRQPREHAGGDRTPARVDDLGAGRRAYLERCSSSAYRFRRAGARRPAGARPPRCDRRRHRGRLARVRAGDGASVAVGGRGCVRVFGWADGPPRLAPVAAPVGR